MAWAGGGAENALIVVDPSSQASMYLGNHYRSARGVPETNVIYMPPGSVDYRMFAGFQVPALLGEIEARGLTDHIDYVVIAGVDSFYVPAVGLVGNVTGRDDEAPPARFALSAAYTLAFQKDDILAGVLRASTANQFYSTSNAAVPLDSNTGYRSGSPSTLKAAQHYFVGFQLGYTGQRGNTLDELIAMVDRSVSSDGSQPEGTFYYMKTDDIRSTPRDPHFAAAVQAIEDLGGSAEVIYKVDDQVQLLPKGRHDVLGVMTGHAWPGIEAADMTLLPGAWGDHLTSFAATFDVGDQEKLSRWIAKGASGSGGTVEEPYVYGTGGVTGKFPHPRLFVWHYQGLTLGESLLRAHQWLPFQDMFYGDPLVQPFALAPEVDVSELPAEPVRGLLSLSPTASAAEGRSVSQIDVLVDGIRVAGGAPGTSFPIRTDMLPDGSHDLRVLAQDDSPARVQGRWVGLVESANAGRSVTVTVAPVRGDLETTFRVEVRAFGPVPPREVQLRQNDRVLAAAGGDHAVFSVPARVLGAGIVNLRAVALYDDGRPAISAAAVAAVHYVDVPQPSASEAPRVFSYTAYLPADQPSLVDLPAMGDGLPERMVVTGPTQATVALSGDALLVSPGPAATGRDQLTYLAATGVLTSSPATVALRYCSDLVIERQPASSVACPGRPARVSVSAVGADLAYRWFLDGQPVPDATGDSLTVTAEQVNGTALVEVEVSSWCGTRPAQYVRSRSAQVAGGPCTHRAMLPLLSTGRAR